MAGILKVLKLNSPKSDYAFHFKLPRDGLSLQSVGFTEENIPELRFVASPKVPTIQEEDVATICRLVSENKRPNFFFRDFPVGHPLQSRRWFREYSPTWLRWTSVGDVLFEVDWNMKGLHVGVRSNKEKTQFQSWPLSSNLTGLATHMDFPNDGSDGSIIMTCDHATVATNDLELSFPKQPKMKITDDGNSLYSKYITKNYDAVAYYDQPIFLKMQELIKLILAVEWLYSKGIKMNEEWMMKHTAKPTSELKQNLHHELTSRKYPPEVPKPTNYVRPDSDLTVATVEAKLNKDLIQRGGVQHFGILDYGGAEIKVFKADGTKCPEVKCLKLFVEQELAIIGTLSGWIYIPLPSSVQPKKFLADQRDEVLKRWKSQVANGEDAAKSLVATSHKVEDLSDESVINLKITETHELPTKSPTTMTYTFTATVDDIDKLFPKKYLNMPVFGYQGNIIIPDVESWEELLSEMSAPVPAVWQNSVYDKDLFQLRGEGGVSTASIPPCEVPPMPVSSVESRNKAKKHHPYKMEERVLFVEAISITTPGMCAIN